MNNEWSQEFVDALEEAISLCAFRFNISVDRKIDLESALQSLFGPDFLLGHATIKR